MRGKIIQKGTGYCVGEIEKNNISIHREFFTDPILEAIIEWEDDYQYLIVVTDKNHPPSFIITNDIEDVRSKSTMFLREGKKVKVLEFTGVINVVDELEPFIEDVSLKRPTKYTF